MSYNSQGGAGMLGWGWQLSGLSMITRCRKNMALNGTVDGVDFDYADAYCVNGQQLRLQSGSHGRINSTYRTAVDDGTVYKIVEELSGTKEFFNRNGRFTRPVYFGPSKWEAYTKSGEILTYGRGSVGATVTRRESIGTSSSYRNQQRQYAWQLQELKDLFNNRFTVSYQHQNHGGNDQAHSLYPTQINYGSAYILFRYQDSAYPNNSFTAGWAYRRHKLLREIEIRVGVDTYYRYSFRYEKNDISRRELLSQIKHCDAENHCKLQRGFAWQKVGSSNHQLSRDLLTRRGRSVQEVTHNSQDPIVLQGDHWAGDFDGDGKQEILFPQTGNIMGMIDGGTVKTFHQRRIGYLHRRSAMVFDLDVDGFDDFVYHDTKNNRIRVMYGTAQGTSRNNQDYVWAVSPGGQMWPMDVDGDGRLDIVSYEGQSYDKYDGNDNLDGAYHHHGYYRYSVVLNKATGPSAAQDWASDTDPYLVVHQDPDAHWPMDVNNDGRTDLVYYTTRGTFGYYYALVSTGSGFQEIQWYREQYPSRKPDKRIHWPADVNGDGQTDLLFQQGGDANYYAVINRGDRTAYHKHWGTRQVGVAFNGTTQWPIDINADGRTDLVYMSHNDNHYYVLISPSEPTQLASHYLAMWKHGDGVDWSGRHWIADTDGDGRSELIYRTHGTNDYKYLFQGGAPTDRIIEIGDISRGYYHNASPELYLLDSGKISISYNTFSNLNPTIRGGMYKVIPLQVVRRVTTRPAVKSNQSIVDNYTYADFAINRLGLGALGFRHMGKDTHYSELGYSTVMYTDYAQFYPFIQGNRIKHIAKSMVYQFQTSS